MNQEYNVNLSQGQKAKLAKAIKDGSALKLRLRKNALSGPDELMLSPRQIAKLQKAKRNNRGVEISFSKSSIRKSLKQGGSLWTSLISLGTKALPLVTKGVAKVAPHLATGALSALGSLGIDKIFGEGAQRPKGMQGGAVLPDAIVKMLQRGIEVPVKFLVNLINMREMLTNAQKTLIGKGLQRGQRIVLKPTKRQIHGGFLGALAAFGIPMAIELASKIFGSGAGQGLQVPRKAGGKGLQTSRKAGTGLQVSQKPFLWQPPPFYGTWEGQGRGKGKKGKGLLLGDNSPFNQIPILGAIL